MPLCFSSRNKEALPLAEHCQAASCQRAAKAYCVDAASTWALAVGPQPDANLRVLWEVVVAALKTKGKSPGWPACLFTFHASVQRHLEQGGATPEVFVVKKHGVLDFVFSAIKVKRSPGEGEAVALQQASKTVKPISSELQRVCASIRLLAQIPSARGLRAHLSDRDLMELEARVPSTLHFVADPEFYKSRPCWIAYMVEHAPIRRPVADQQRFAAACVRGAAFRGELAHFVEADRMRMRLSNFIEPAAVPFLELKDTHGMLFDRIAGAFVSMFGGRLVGAVQRAIVALLEGRSKHSAELSAKVLHSKKPLALPANDLANFAAGFFLRNH
mmetsp:Transcript_64762/g.173493  ORF Transcript_64762/g.173493 Transcript_64762/m.173493 type:complete len:330 (-) Transcript_64762:3107-4096(-)